MEQPPESYTVEILRNPLNDRYALSEAWKDLAGRFHRFDGPAFVRRCADGTVDEQRWFFHGVQYLPEGRPRNGRGLPSSVTKRNIEGLREAKRLMKSARRERYIVETFVHPTARIVLTETWKNGQGVLHRIGGPAFTQRNGSNIVLTQMWVENGRVLRVVHPPPPRGQYDLSMPDDLLRWHKAIVEMKRFDEQIKEKAAFRSDSSPTP